MRKKLFQKVPWDTVTLLLLFALLGLGLVMLWSASSIMAEKRFGNAYYFFKPQIMYAVLGLLVMWLVQKVPYQIWPKLAPLILLLTAGALLAVQIPTVGHRVGGASRWIKIFGFSVQPSELAKLAIVFFMAYSLVTKGEKIKTLTYGVLPHLLVLSILVALILAGPDLGTAIVVALIALIIMFVAGVPFRHLLALGLMSAPILVYLITSKDFRMRRINAWVDPWTDPLGGGYHVIHSIYAFATGGIFGAGPGCSQQKLFYLPEPHTDFIFSVLGEELGLLGVFLVAFLFLILVIRGLMIAATAKDLTGTYLAVGLTMVIGVPAFLNMAVVLNILPTKGMPLPFFSYGGTNLLVCFVAVGILLNISGQAKLANQQPKIAGALAAAKGNG